MTAIETAEAIEMGYKELQSAVQTETDGPGHTFLLAQLAPEAARHIRELIEIGNLFRFAAKNTTQVGTTFDICDEWDRLTGYNGDDND